MNGFEAFVYFIVGIILLILGIILYIAILKIRDNTEETNILLQKLIDSQNSTSPKRNKDLLDEDTKTKKFIEILEKADEKNKEKEFEAVERN